VVVFREFERLPAGAQMASGVGLGLSIVQRLSRVLEHEVSLRSVAEKGSVFSVTLPLAAPSTAVATAMNPAAPIRQGSLERLVVAAIDNEPAILTGMTVLLQGWGCIVAGGTGLRMIEMALTARDLMPDVIVADYHVGELDGLAIIAALRRRFGPCPAVLITADRDLKVRDLAQAADVRVLYKPLKPAALRSLLSQWRLMKAAAE
jgi:CheY-like chemotaxis protein